MIKYLPSEVLKKIAPKNKVEKLLTGNLTLNKAVLSMLTDADFISKESVEKTALKTIKGYKERVKEGDSKSEAVNDKKLLVNRVQNEILFQVSDEIEDQYRGEYYRWLPSDADEPDPIHQLKYGKKYQIGRGEMPGDRYGCKCGMLILVKESKLKL